MTYKFGGIAYFIRIRQFKRFFLSTYRNENVLLVNYKDSNILLFSTKTNLTFFSNGEAIFNDGTFKSFPNIFTQFFTVHGWQNGNYISLLFFYFLIRNQKPMKNRFCIFWKGNIFSYFISLAVYNIKDVDLIWIKVDVGKYKQLT